MRARLAAVGLVAALFVGCSSTPPQKAAPVDVTVTVTLPNGQPGKDLILMMLPATADQIQGGGKTDATGKVATKLTPGKYTYAFDNTPVGVPVKYHSNNAANAVEVTADTKDLAIKLTN